MCESTSILIVEDNPVNARILEVHLQKSDYETVVAPTAKMALAYLTSSPQIELIIADIMMPEMDGLQLLGKIKGQPEWRDIPVIMCSSLADLHENAIYFGAERLKALVENLSERQTRIGTDTGGSDHLLLLKELRLVYSALEGNRSRGSKAPYKPKPTRHRSSKKTDSEAIGRCNVREPEQGNEKGLLANQRNRCQFGEI